MTNIYYKTNQIQQLRGFYYTAQLKNVSLAAKLMNLTQPSVTLQIKSLESDLKVKLFYRSKNEMLLTGDGEKLFVKVEKIIKQVDDVYLNFANEQQMEDKVLNIAANHGSISYILPQLIKKFNQNKDKARRVIKIHYATKDNGLKMLNKGDADIFFTPKNVELSEEYEYHHLRNYSVFLIADKNHPLAKKSEITFADLSKYNLTMPAEGLKVIPNLREVFAHNKSNINCSLEFSNWELTKQFVKAGVAISIVTELVLDKRDDLFVYPMKEYFSDVSYGYVLAKKHKKTKILQEFLGMLELVYSV